jgi:hypothetical protein
MRRVRLKVWDEAAGSEMAAVDMVDLLRAVEEN